MRVWRERLDRPPGNQFVQLAVDGTTLVGFVCAYGAHDPQWGSFVDNLHVATASKRNGRVVAHEAGRSLACPLGPRLWGLSLGSGGQLLGEAFLRAPRCPERRRINDGDLTVAPWYAAVSTPGHTPSCCLPPNKRLAADGRQLSLPCGVRGRPTVTAHTRYAPGAQRLAGIATAPVTVGDRRLVERAPDGASLIASNERDPSFVGRRITR